MIRRAYRLSSRDPRANLAAEESLLERPRSDEGLLLLYANEASCVVGRNQNPWAEVAGDAGLPVYRRVSGGGTVYHDGGNLNWAFILPRPEHDRGAELALVIEALRDGLGIELKEGERGGLYVASGPFEGRKVSGTARRLSATRVLHHGTLLVSSDLVRLGRSLGGLELSASRALPSVGSPAVNLSSLIPALTIDQAASALALSICGSEAEVLGPEDLGLLADRAYAAASSERLGSWDWTWGATPPFALDLDWREGRLRLELRGGLISSASGPGAEVLSPFLGRRFDYSSPSFCLRALEGIDVHEVFIPFP